MGAPLEETSTWTVQAGVEHRKESTDMMETIELAIVVFSVGFMLWWWAF
jgi:hypothetical protein